MRFTRTTLAIGVFAAVLPFAASAADNVKIAVIDPLSGPFANVGEAMVRHAQLSADAINAKGGVLGGAKFEIIALDSKSNPQEAQLAAKQAIDQGVCSIAPIGSESRHELQPFELIASRLAVGDEFNEPRK